MPSGPPARTGQRASKRAERDRKIFALRQAGLTLEAIARELSISKGSVFQSMERVLREYKEQLASQVKDVAQLELSRLDRLLIGVWPAASTGDPQAVASALRIMERRSAYMGLDAPTKSMVAVAQKTSTGLPPPPPAQALPAAPLALEGRNDDDLTLLYRQAVAASTAVPTEPGVSSDRVGEMSAITVLPVQ